MLQSLPINVYVERQLQILLLSEKANTTVGGWSFITSQ